MDAKWEAGIGCNKRPGGTYERGRDQRHSGTSIDVTWNDPVDNGTGPITGYTVSWIDLTKFTLGNRYKFTVAATNAKGAGASSLKSPALLAGGWGWPPPRPLPLRSRRRGPQRPEPAQAAQPPTGLCQYRWRYGPAPSPGAPNPL